MTSLGQGLVALGGMALVWAGAAKLRTAVDAAPQLGQHLSWMRDGRRVRALAVVEVGAGVSALLSAVADGALATLLATPMVLLFAGFTGVLVRSVGRGISTPCGCFGADVGRPSSVRSSLARAGGLLVVGLAGTAMVASSEAEVTPTPGAAFGVVVAGFAVAACVRLTGTVWTLRAQVRPEPS